MGRSDMTNTDGEERRAGLPDEPQLHKSGEWMKMFRRLRFGNARDGVRGATIKAVGTMLGTYANYKDGGRIRPGTARVAIDCEVDYRTAKRCIAILRDLGLIVLVQKADRRGYSDVYCLGWPQDLVSRPEVDVWDPDRYELEIALVREKHRGKYKPAAKGLRGTEGTAEVPSFETAPDESAGHGRHRRTESAGHAGTNLRGTPCPPTYQSTYQGFVPSDEIDLSAKVTVSRANSHEDPISPPLDLAQPPSAPCADSHAAEVIPIDTPGRSPCVHGKSARRNKSGVPRCDECRAAQQEPPPPDECSHGVKIRYRCPACARGLLEASHDQQQN